MKKKVIIVGGGFGGLETALSLWYLRKSSVAITLIDRSVYHSFIPSIHDVVSGKVRQRDIQIPLSVVLSPTDIHFVQDEVVSVDPVNRQVTTCTRAMEFDYLVLSSGAENNFFGVTGAEEFSHRFRSPEDAERIYSDVSELLKEGKSRCNLIVAGGGAEGVEVAGELIDLVKERGYEKDLVSGKITVEVIDKARLLTAFPPKALDFVEEYLSRLGVKVFTGSPIVEVQKDKVVLESGVHRDMSILIWAGGIQPSKIIQGLPLSKDAQGWLKVTDRLHSPDNESVYGVGDIISVSGEGGPIAVPRLAYHALDQARIASLNIYYHIQGRRSIGYVPKPTLQLVSIGKHMGILMQGERVVTGPSVVLLKKMVQMRHLMTYLTKPALSAISSKLPGAELRHPLRFIKWFLPI
jgi:NADH dehydrogenase